MAAPRRKAGGQRKPKPPGPPPEPPQIDLGGSDGGGTSDGTSGGGGTSAEPEPKTFAEKAAKRAQKKKNVVRSYILALKARDIPLGPFRKLLIHAAKTGQTIPEFLTEVGLSKKFNKMFPGIQALAESLGAEVSADLVGTYKEAVLAYQKAAKDAGISLGLGKSQIAILLRGDVSPVEFADRLQAFGALQANASSLEALNDAAAQVGLGKLDINGQLKFLMGLGAKDYYDLYESLFFAQKGFDTDTARALGQAVGLIGKPTDALAALPDAVAALEGVAGQEFKQSGVTRPDLYLAALVASGESISDPALAERARKAREAVEQQLKNRQARLAARQAIQTQRPGRPLLPGARAEELATV